MIVTQKNLHDNNSCFNLETKDNKTEIAIKTLFNNMSTGTHFDVIKCETINKKINQLFAFTSNHNENKTIIYHTLKTINKYSYEKLEQLAICIGQTFYEPHGISSSFNKILDFLKDILKKNKLTLDNFPDEVKCGLEKIEYVIKTSEKYRPDENKTKSKHIYFTILPLADLLSFRSTSKENKNIVNRELKNRINQGKFPFKNEKGLLIFFGEDSKNIKHLNLSGMIFYDLSFLNLFKQLVNVNFENCSFFKVDFTKLPHDQKLYRFNNATIFLPSNEKSQPKHYDYLYKLPNIETKGIKTKELANFKHKINAKDLDEELDDVLNNELERRTGTENDKKMANELLVNFINSFCEKNRSFPPIFTIWTKLFNHPKGINKNITSSKDIIEFFGESSKDLRFLFLPELLNLYDLQDLSECTQLEDFLIEDCGQICNLNFLENCPKICRIYVGDCDNITLTSLEFLSKYKFLHISIQGCQKITNWDLNYLNEILEDNVNVVYYNGERISLNLFSRHLIPFHTYYRERIIANFLLNVRDSVQDYMNPQLS